MSEDYDTFSYDDDDALYEPVLDSSLPPVPPRNPRFNPRRMTPPTLAVPQEPDSNYEDLNEVKRAPPPRPDSGPRAPLPKPDSGSDPELNYEDLSDANPENYEELPDVNERPSLPPPPILPQRIRPSLPDTPSRKNGWSAPKLEFVNTDILNAIRKNLKKTEPRSQKESPKSQLPAQPEVVVKPPLQQNKPHLPPKPFLSKMSSGITAKVKALSFDSNDGTPSPKTAEQKFPNNNLSFNEKTSVSQTAKVSPLRSELTQMNTVSQNAKVPPLRTELKQMSNVSQNAKVPPLRTELKQMSNEENSEEDEEEFDSLGEYMDAAEVKSLHCQPYYFEAFNKSQEHKIFNENTEDGTFVIRKSRGQNSTHPYTILVYYDSRAFRLKIRFEDAQYAIGERKADEIKFPSVIELVEHYEQTPLMLIGAGSTTLKHSWKSF